MTRPIKTRVYSILESNIKSDWKARWFDRFMMVLIISNVAAVLIETLPNLSPDFRVFFDAFDLFSVSVFTIEYVTRVWVCTENKAEGYGSPFIGRLKYMVSPLALIDLLAILPFYLAMFISVDLRFMRVFRLLRLLKLTRYSPAMETFASVIAAQRRPLGAAILVMLVMLVFASSIAYLFERDAQPEAFASIPHAMWWGLATLTTVGFGDVTPITPGGKLFGAIIMIMGVGMFALPAGILTSGFTRELRKRDFVVTWQLVAKVPLFSHLDALEISEIATLLHPKHVPARFAVVKRGEHADSMYFIVSGEVEVELHPEPRLLSDGEFFGEIALMKDIKRTATVMSLTECQLLYLDTHDFHHLLEQHPEVRAPIENAMKSRLQELEELGLTH